MNNTSRLIVHDRMVVFGPENAGQPMSVEGWILADLDHFFDQLLIALLHWVFIPTPSAVQMYEEDHA